MIRLRVGLSGKNDKHGNLVAPLSPTTPSGKIVLRLQSVLPEVKHINTNLVSYAPLDTTGTLRYPTDDECKEGINVLSSMIQQIKPTHIIALGKQVGEYIFLLKTECIVISLPHPSYVFRRQKTLLPKIEKELLQRK